MILNSFTKKFLQYFHKVQNFIHYCKKGIINSSPDIIFSVIKNTQNYKLFIPWCSNSHIISTISPYQNYTSLTIEFPKIKSISYVSHVHISGEHNNNQNFKIQSVCKQFPMKSLVSIWEIQKFPPAASNQQSVVHYSISYEFASPLLQLTSHLFLDYVGQSMWQIFKDESERIEKSTQIRIKRQQQQINQNINVNRIINNSFCHPPSSQPERLIKSCSSSVFLQNISQCYSPLIFPQNLSQCCSSSVLPQNLSEYLIKNKNIHQFYSLNEQFRLKMNQWGKKLHGTQNFQDKLSFNIKNYFIHKN